jgi:hypothetical protein
MKSVASRVPQVVSVLSLIIFFAYVNDIFRTIKCNVRRFADYCVIYGKVSDGCFIDKLQTDMNRLGVLAVETEM